MNNSVGETTMDKFCKPGNGAQTCRYLTCDPDGFKCQKHNGMLGPYIDQRVQAGHMVAIGDNCPGIGAKQ